MIRNLYIFPDYIFIFRVYIILILIVFIDNSNVTSRADYLQEELTPTNELQLPKLFTCNLKSKSLIEPAIQNLFTTHSTYFFGWNVSLDYLISRYSSLGLGIEVSSCKQHDDNGWIITDLNYRSLYLNYKFNLCKVHRFGIFINVSAGASFSQYNKVQKKRILTVNDISEHGLFFYSGAGFYYKIMKYVKPFLDIGFKGFHMSFNSLDINPHGLNIGFGLLITIF